ncbi:MAG: family 14 glycosylhydrolase [Gammaproteobacteria bacterium]|nr:family 14 glycosylhydrolase [Gammaproteobacteria bacterium]
MMSFKSVGKEHKISANVMAPLWLETPQQWSIFKQDLAIAHKIGIRAVTVDVWWGAVEQQGDQIFDWTYYDKVFAEINNRNLKIIPIMSFHQCGGNVGDSCNIPLPQWIWQHFPQTTTQQLQYKSEQGNYSKEFVSLWANELVLPQYIEFMQAFEQQFQQYSGIIDELNVSMGPAGELRFPSYNQHDQGTGYPTRGAWQVYGEKQTIELQKYLIKNYPSVDLLNKEWQSNYRSFNEITIPLPNKCAAQQCKDTVAWFHQSLLNHGKKMLLAANKGFSNAFSNISLGFKIPGIHWLMAKQGKWHRAAEIAAGLIPSEPGKGNHYANIVKLANTELGNDRGIILHFTALEMSNNPTAPSYSMANDLVIEVANEAKRQGVIVKGENALAAGVTNKHGWDNINRHFQHNRFKGITVLRLTNVTSGYGKSAFTDFIQKYTMR